MNKFKRNERIAAITQILVNAPNKVFTLTCFTEIFAASKSTISEDLVIVKDIFDIIKKISSQGVTILLIEQNAKAALEISDYGYVLETGTIVLEGPGKDLLTNEEVKKAYLGT